MEALALTLALLSAAEPRLLPRSEEMPFRGDLTYPEPPHAAPGMLWIAGGSTLAFLGAFPTFAGGLAVRDGDGAALPFVIGGALAVTVGLGLLVYGMQRLASYVDDTQVHSVALQSIDMLDGTRNRPLWAKSTAELDAEYAELQRALPPLAPPTAMVVAGVLVLHASVALGVLAGNGRSNHPATSPWASYTWASVGTAAIGLVGVAAGTFWARRTIAARSELEERRDDIGAELRARWLMPAWP